MRMSKLSRIAILFVVVLSLQNSFAQDVSRVDVPEGANARLGKGRLIYGAVYSPDGGQIFVPSSRGIWRHDVRTGETVDLQTLDRWSDFSGSVSSVAYSPDGSTIAGEYYDSVWLWNTRTGEFLYTLEGHEGLITSVAFSPDGKTIASGSWDDTIRLWDVTTGELLHKLEGHSGVVKSVTFSPDGRMLASGGGDVRFYDDTIRLWDTATGELLHTHEWKDEFWVIFMTFSPDGKTLVSSGMDDNTIRLWDVGSWELLHTLEGHTGPVYPVAFSPDGKTLASGSNDNTIRLWDAVTGDHILSLEGHTEDVGSVAFSPDGSTLASGSWREEDWLLSEKLGDSTIRLWDATTGELLHTLGGYTVSAVNSVAFSPDGNFIASAYGAWELDEEFTVEVWDTRTGEHTQTLEQIGDHDRTWVRSVTYSPDGSTIAGGGGNNDVLLWDAATGEHTLSIKGHVDSVKSVVYSPDGRMIASAGDDYTVRLWDATTGELLHMFDSVSAGSTAFSPDGRTLASGGGIFHRDDRVQLWDTRTGELIRTLNEHTAWVFSVVYSPDGSIIATGSADLTIRLWDAATGHLLHTLEGHRDFVASVVFSPEGKTLASGSHDGTIRLWDVTTGEHIDTLNTLVRVGDVNWVTSVAFSPDGSTLACDDGGTILLWSVPAVQAEVAVEPLAKRFTTLGNIKRTALLQNFPNPFNPETWIPYQLAEDAPVTLTIYNQSGRVVRTLELGNQSSGSYERRDKAAYWDGRNEDGEVVTSGAYFYQLRAGDYTALRRMVIVK